MFPTTKLSVCIGMVLPVWFCIVACLLNRTAHSLYAQETQTLIFDEERSQPSVIQKVSGDGITMTAGERTLKLALDEVQQIEFNPVDPIASASKIEVLLMDGSKIFVDEIAVAERTAHMREIGDFEFSADTRNIRYIDFVGHRSPPSSDEWTQIVESTKNTEDMLIIQRDERLEYLEGLVGQITSDTINFAMGDRRVDVQRQAVDGVVYYHAAGRSFDEPICIGNTRGGSQLMIRSVERAETNTFRLETVCGVTALIGAHHLINLDFTAGRQAVLSHLKPITIQWQPLILNSQLLEYQRQLNQPRFDESFEGKPLQLEFPVEREMLRRYQLREFDHGLAAKGGTKLVYDLDQRFERLQGTIGFSPHASFDGIVEVAILGDQRELFRQVMMRRDRQPIDIELPIKGVARLTLLVDYHDGRNVGDVIHFCDMKVTR